MAQVRQPNERLRALVAQAGWSGADLAAAVNTIGAETGQTLHYDRTAVGHWMAGTRPRPPVPALIAEALTRRLGGPVSPLDFFPGQAKHLPPGTSLWEMDAVTRLVDLNTERRSALQGGVYSVLALALPAWGRAAPLPPPTARAAEPSGTPAATTATAMIRVFSDCDAAFGGGHALAAATGYLGGAIAPHLRTARTETARRALFTAATELAYLCAFMNFDQNHNDRAQAYYHTALQLAVENHDPTAYAVTLRALSVQAHALGHHQRAQTLAETALEGAPRALPAATRAFLQGQAAVGAAAAGDRHAALAHLNTAERQLDRIPVSDSPIGAYHPASLAHQQATVLRALGDRAAAITVLAASIRNRPLTERRSRALTTATLAELHLDHGHLDQAAATWHLFLDDYPHLNSRRADTALTTLRARLRPHHRNPAAAPPCNAPPAPGRPGNRPAAAHRVFPMPPRRDPPRMPDPAPSPRPRSHPRSERAACPRRHATSSVPFNACPTFHTTDRARPGPPAPGTALLEQAPDPHPHHREIDRAAPAPTRP
ncbi:tetratricopeptide repeat protein [Streptacidiphilus sp. PAMC 29251]